MDLLGMIALLVLIQGEKYMALGNADVIPGNSRLQAISSILILIIVYFLVQANLQVNIMGMLIRKNVFFNAQQILRQLMVSCLQMMYLDNVLQHVQLQLLSGIKPKTYSTM